MKRKFLLTIFLSVTSLSVWAEIVTDGTLGQKLNLSGPDFQITPDLGQQHGGNLFHSFQDFNLNSLESATFSGPNSVNSIISRVTGGNPSLIDGLIRSTIPNADMYFLNPYGIMFGPNAQLDVQGSFHTSTADYLKLGEDGRFDARNPSDSLLTVAPVSAFGFLTDNPAPITIDNSKLSVPDGKTFSLVSGDLDIKGDDFFYYVDWFFRPFEVVIEDEKSSIIKAKGGNINLVSLSTKGEITDFNPEKNMKGGDITIHNSHIDVSSEGGTHIFIYGSDINIINSGINSIVYGEVDDTKIDIHADNLTFKDSSVMVAASTNG
ncbi:MAG: filamentous hemagglutinin N-terminal domain-containing protein, partial [Proteobacteria bacterium]|nr:filamentous hemagglutinin N-terminal domain-containing protein [Pseudomonadota bacterium]